MSERTRRQHHVPQFYLRHFTSDGTHLFAFNKDDKRSFSSSTKGVGQDRDFYNICEKLDDNYVDPLIIDKSITNLEGTLSQWFSEALESLEQSGTITEDQRYQLSLYVAFQYFRTKEFRALSVETVEKLAEADMSILLQQMGIDVPPESFEATFDREKASMLQASRLFDLPTMAEAACGLGSHIWVFGENTTGQPFYTSDNPIASRPHSGIHGILARGIELAFPLSSNRILVMFDRRSFKEKESLEMTTSNFSEEEAEDYNTLQVKSS